MEPYTTVKEAASAELIEKRSRFIGYAAPVSSAEMAADVINGVKARHRDARHNCYAYSLRSGAQRYSDDGEPQGTAGIPILEILKRENIADCVIVVTRYFGGILLGAPGLVRAYGGAAKLAVTAAGTILVRPFSLIVITVDYTFYDRVNLLLGDSGAVTMDSDFAERVKISARIPADSASHVEKAIRELTGNKAIFEITGEVFA